MRRILALAAVALLLLVLAAPNVVSGDSSRRFEASLSSYQEVPTLSTTGRGTFRAELEGSTLHYRLRYTGLEGGPAMAAHIHLGRPAVSGGVIAWLCGGGGKPACPANGVTISGDIVAADVVGPAGQGIAPQEFNELIRAMRARATYVNVHNETYPNGEIRGQIVRD